MCVQVYVQAHVPKSQFLTLQMADLVVAVFLAKIFLKVVCHYLLLSMAKMK